MRCALVYSDVMQRYDFGPGHPFRGDRHTAFMELFMKEIGTGRGFDIVEPAPAGDEDLQLVHSPQYIGFVKEEGVDFLGGTSWGYMDPDTPLGPGMNAAARMIAGAGLRAGELVASGQYDVAVSVGGGMHHARPSRGAGFCIFNDVALCVRSLLQRRGLERILVIDTDGHAGDGTAEIFSGDPRVLVISIHQDPRTLYPGTGFAHQIGQGEGQGFTVNIPLPPRTGILPYLYAMEQVFLPMAREFRPQLILRNGGADPHFQDELVRLGITVEGFQRIGRVVREAAEALCG
ncbi:MAG: acetoin utilization protein AcuC, partial [Deltaproteobacteria bacterium]|nr:acetoin utilization protein AcuC [Deltaproteobacteria bacterium]